jgi:hypothetical protein
MIVHLRTSPLKEWTFQADNVNQTLSSSLTPQA